MKISKILLTVLLILTLATSLKAADDGLTEVEIYMPIPELETTRPEKEVVIYDITQFYDELDSDEPYDVLAYELKRRVKDERLMVDRTVDTYNGVASVKLSPYHVYLVTTRDAYIDDFVILGPLELNTDQVLKIYPKALPSYEEEDDYEEDRPKKDPIPFNPTVTKKTNPPIEKPNPDAFQDPTDPVEDAPVQGEVPRESVKTGDIQHKKSTSVLAFTGLLFILVAFIFIKPKALK